MKTPNKKSGNKEDVSTKQFDDVLRRMLSTPPPKPEPKQQKKKTGQ